MADRLQKCISITQEALDMLDSMVKADQTSRSGKIRQLIVDEYRRRYDFHPHPKPEAS